MSTALFEERSFRAPIPGVTAPRLPLLEDPDDDFTRPSTRDTPVPSPPGAGWKRLPGFTPSASAPGRKGGGGHGAAEDAPVEPRDREPWLPERAESPVSSR